jgi:hypothetical protein
MYGQRLLFCDQSQAFERMHILCLFGVMKLYGFGYCDSSVREKDCRCRTLGTQAT